MTAARKLLAARESFVTEVDGRELIVRAGDVVEADHPVAKAHAHYFEPADEPDLVEDAPPRKRRR
jgi:hypothetical protein